MEKNMESCLIFAWLFVLPVLPYQLSLPGVMFALTIRPLQFQLAAATSVAAAEAVELLQQLQPPAEAEAREDPDSEPRVQA